MKKYILKISSLIIVLVTIILASGCTASDSVPVTNSPVNPLNVTGTVSSNGTFTGNVTGTVNILQNVVVDHHNSSTANITAGATFTGTSTSTLGVAAIQVSLKTDQNCYVYIDQSPNGINWDVTAAYNYTYSLGGYAWTVKAVNSYVRVRVTNKGTVQTTYVRLQTCLCPITEPLPFATSEDDRLRTETTLVDEYGWNAEFTPFNELRVASTYKLAGTVFIGSTLDSNFVSVNTSGGGTVTQTGGQMILQTNGAANGYAEAFSQRRGRFVAGESNMAKLVIQLPDTGLAKNLRRWGIGDLPAGSATISDGAFFFLNGTTFGIATLKGGVSTNITSGNFNGTYGSTYILDTNVHTYEIYYSPYKVYFSLDGELLHTINALTAPWSNTVTLYVGMDNRNSGGLTTNRIMYCRAFSISRLGNTESSPNFKHINSNGTYVLKYGAGRIHSIIINTPTNSTITIYDNTTVVTANMMSLISLGNNTVPIELHYDMDFYTGLVVVSSGSADITVIYE